MNRFEDFPARFTEAHDEPQRNEHAASSQTVNGKDQGDRSELELARVSDWADIPVPRREWAVPDLVPARNVTLLSGEGGLGKSLLLQQLAVATVTGKPWIGRYPMQGPFLGLFCEDDRDELHRRFADIAGHYGVPLSDLANLHVRSLAGEDAVLAAPEQRSGGLMQPSALYERLMRAAERIRPRIIAIDTSADAFAGNENDRAQVRQFIGLLRRLAMGSGAAIVLSSHPSLTGVTSGSGISGSTAWNASVRSRLYLKRPAPSEDERPDADTRILECMKSNYGPAGESIALRWERGVFVPVDVEKPHWIDRHAADRAAEEKFLALLRIFTAQNRNVSATKTAPNFAATLFAKDPSAKGITKKQFESAMNTLFSEERITNLEYGRPSRPQYRIVEAEGGPEDGGDEREATP